MFGSLLKVKHNNTIKNALPYARHNSVIKPVKEVWVRSNSVIKRVWSALVVGVTGQFSPVAQGGGFYRDRGVFSAYRSPSSQPAITAYQWGFSDFGGQLIVTGGTTSSTLTLLAPSYSTAPASFSVTVWCTVTVGGVQVRTPDYTYEYNGPLA